MTRPVRPDDDSPLLTVGVPGRGDRRYRLQAPFVAITLFFTLAPLVSVLARPPQPAALVLLLVGWAIFGLVLVRLFRLGPFASALADRWIALAALALTAIALVSQVVFGVSEATALYFYAGVTAARLESERERRGSRSSPWWRRWGLARSPGTGRTV